MPKPRAKNRWLKECGLKHVTTSKGFYVYRPYSNGKFGKQVSLGKITDSRLDIIAAYEREIKNKDDSLEWLLTIYSKRKDAPTNQRNYDSVKKKLLLDFGNVRLKQIDFISVQSYLDTKGNVASNRAIQHLKAAWNWARYRYPDLVPQVNPCAGAQLNKETARTKLITDAEYQAVYSVALEQRQPFLAVMMELAYLCRMRMSEARLLKRADLLEQGIYVQRAKGSKPEITLYSPRLTSAIELGKSINSDALSPYLLHNSRGQPITASQFKMAWHRACVKAGYKIMDGSTVIKKAGFTFHDIKAMGVTHHPDKESGHKSKKMAAVYDRLPKEVKSTK